MLQGAKIEGPYMCHHCGHTENHFYQTVEKWDTKNRIYLCSKECYNRYHRVSDQFAQQHVTPRTQHATVRITASVSVNVQNLPNVPDDSTDVKDDNKQAASSVTAVARAPAPIPAQASCLTKIASCCQGIKNCLGC